MVAVESKQDLSIMAHLLRRAGFGATLDELDRAMEKGVRHRSGRTAEPR